MKAAKFRELSTEELSGRVRELKAELFNLRFQMAIGQLQNPMSIKECKKNIARALTILHEREQLDAKAQ